MVNIVLTGLSGSGKSTLAKALALRLGMKAVDIDALIEERAGTTIGEIFEKQGEPAFRDLETQLVLEEAAQTGAVIATGGGAVLREQNVAALKKNGVIVFVDRPTEQIVRDLECGHRPLLAGGADKIHRMAEERRPVYVNTADMVFANTGTAVQAVEKLAGIFGGSQGPSYCVIGDPIAHSLSPAIHRMVFAAMGKNAAYNLCHVKRGELPAFVQSARLAQLQGFNITAPHKQDVIPLLDEIEEEARLCGAVNTVVLRDGRLVGCNTDMEGLHLAVQDAGAGYRDRHVTVLGTGGAAAGVVFKAAREGAATVHILGRRPEAAAAVRDRISAIVPGAGIIAGDMGSESLAKAAKGCDVLINSVPPATPLAAVSMVPDLPSHARVVDMAYSPPRTPLLLAAEQRGLKVQNGLAMLIYQALLADEEYLGVELNKPILYRMVSDALSLREKGRKRR